MEKIYKQLAEHLDRIPNGFPATDSGVELKILARLFTPQEAATACHLSLQAQTAKTVAQAMGKEERETFNVLKAMVKKGLIDASRHEGGLGFKLIPFVVGFYERQNGQIDKDFAELFETYYNEALHHMMMVKPSVHRVIPVEKTIPLGIDVLPYERASTYIKDAKSWGVLDCICRVQRRLVGHGCDHTVENCLVLSHKPNAFKASDTIRTITLEEALAILVQADKEGLIHSTNNVQDGVDYICNCCSCCCGVTRGMTEFGNPDAVDRSHFYAAVDETQCTGCETCLERCMFHALEMVDGTCHVDKSRCFGCGLCVTACPAAALRLERKPDAEIIPPPINESEWRALRSASRNQESN